jgi:hypothetical protein
MLIARATFTFLVILTLSPARHVLEDRSLQTRPTSKWMMPFCIWYSYIWVCKDPGGLTHASHRYDVTRSTSSCCQLFRAFRARALFVRGVIHPNFIVVPSRQKGGVRVLSKRAGSSGFSWRIHSLAKNSLNLHRAGFEPQHTSPFRNRVKASPPNTRRSRLSPSDDPSFCATLYNVGVLLSATSGQNFCVIVTLSDHRLIRTRNERGRLVTASPVMPKSWGPSWGKQLPRAAS